MGIIDDVKQKVKNVMEQYAETKKRFDDEITRIEAEISERNEAVKAARAVIEQKAMELEETTEEERQVEEDADIIKRLTERLELVKRSKRQALASILPAMKSHFEAKREAVKNELEQQIDIINRRRAELLKEVQTLFEIDERARKLYAELNAIKREVGEKAAGYGNGSFVEGRFNMANDNWGFFGKDKTAAQLLNVPLWMVQDAKNGIIPEPLRKNFE